MKVGIFVFATDHSLDTAILAKRTEDLGFESFWVPEHTVIPVHATTPFPDDRTDGSIPDYYSWIVDPFVSLSRASGVTRTIKLGTGICLVPERNPLLLAKEVATLDMLSGGRFLFGIGAGWLREETEVMGASSKSRWSQTRESVLAMKELWGKEESEYHGEHYDFPPVRSFPKPAQVPHPPILLGSTARSVFRRIVEYGDGWMPNRLSVEDLRLGRETLSRLAEEAGRDPASIEVTAFGLEGQYRDREIIKDLEKAGAGRVTVWLTRSDGDAALAEMEQIARQVL